MYSSNGNNANYNIQKSTYILFKDILILDYRKPETDSKSATSSAFRHHYQLFFSFLYEFFYFKSLKKKFWKLQDESLLAARGHIAAISSVRRHYNNTHTCLSISLLVVSFLPNFKKVIIFSIYHVKSLLV